MKKCLSVILLIVVTIGIALLVFWAPSPVDLGYRTSARLYDGYLASPETFVAEIDVKEIAESLQQAKWKWSLLGPIWKGAWTIDVDKRTTIQISYYGAFFSVGDKNGYFVVQPKDRPVFDSFCRHISEDLVIPWRLKRNNRKQETQANQALRPTPAPVTAPTQEPRQP